MKRLLEIIAVAASSIRCPAMASTQSGDSDGEAKWDRL